jgi:hypothetical protein
MAAFNALMFGTLLFRSRLVPRAIPALGLIGAPLLISFVVGTMLGLTDVGSAWHAIATFPFFFWEFGVALWMTFKGFDPTVPVALRYAAETQTANAPQALSAGPAVTTSEGGAA